MASLGQGGIVGAITITKVADGLSFLAEVGLDGLLAGGILGGNVQELPSCARGLMAKHVDEHLAGHPTDEGVDHIGVIDVWELFALEGLTSPLLVVAEILGVP
jgi:hypothetical protein